MSVTTRPKTAALAVATAVTLLAAATTAALSATPPSQVMTFVDRRNGLSLSLELEPARSDAGHFVLQVAGRGAYSGTAASAMRVLTPTSVVVHYDGPATLRGFRGAGPASPQGVVVSLQAQLDPAHHTAEATLTDGSSRFHLVVPAVGSGGTETVLRAFESAMGADDGGALYDLLSADYTARRSRAAFADEWARQSATVGRLTGLTRTAVGATQTNDLGSTTIVATYGATAIVPGGPSRQVSFDATFVREGDGWKLWYTTEPH